MPDFFNMKARYGERSCDTCAFAHDWDDEMTCLCSNDRSINDQEKKKERSCTVYQKCPGWQRSRG